MPCISLLLFVLLLLFVVKHFRCSCSVDNLSNCNRLIGLSIFFFPNLTWEHPLSLEVFLSIADKREAPIALETQVFTWDLGTTRSDRGRSFHLVEELIEF